MSEVQRRQFVDRSEQQEAICSSQAHRLIVNAYAGCGKSKTLEEYADDRWRKKLLYVVLNTSVRDGAIGKFGQNTDIVTIFGLANRHVGRLYRSKLLADGELKPFHLGYPDKVIAARAIKTLNNFLMSLDDEISVEHVDGAEEAGTVVDLARNTWDSMQETAGGIPMTHQGYLKLFQLSKPKLDYGGIMCDEGQDASPIFLDILGHQKAPVVLVGDHYQSIYAFTGAVNAMREFEADEQLRLSTSYRFGPGIAELATNIISTNFGETEPLRGVSGIETDWIFGMHDPHTIICRTNAMVFDEAVMQLERKNPFGFVGGIEGYRLGLIEDAFSLFSCQPGNIRDRFLAGFKSWAEMKDYAELLDDKELGILRKVVEKYGPRIPALVRDIRAAAKAPVNPGRGVLLSTAHKAKGLEWDNVRLTNDFANMADWNPVKPPSKQDINLIYVAVTRAKKRLIKNQFLLDWESKIKERPLIVKKRGVRRPIA